MPRWERPRGRAGLLSAGTPPSWLAELATASILIVLPPTLLLGIAFPLAGQVVAAGVQGVGSRIGRLAACNTLGSIVGSLATGFLLVPRIGTLNTVALLAALNLGAALLLQARRFPFHGTLVHRRDRLSAPGGGGFRAAVRPPGSLVGGARGKQIYFAGGRHRRGGGTRSARAREAYRRLYVNQTVRLHVDHARRYQAARSSPGAASEAGALPRHRLGTGTAAPVRHPRRLRRLCRPLTGGVRRRIPACRGERRWARDPKARLIQRTVGTSCPREQARPDHPRAAPRFAGVADLFT